MGHRSRMLVLAAVALSLLVAAVAVSNAGPRDHEDGFFLRLSAGGGMASTETRVHGSCDAELDGPAGDVNFAIGGIVRPNLALHATLYGWIISNPEMTFHGLTETVSANLGLTAVGAGVTYYLMPTNVYFSPSAGFGSLTVESDDISVKSAYGLVLDFTVGKEWWVNDDWGLGVAGGVTYHSISDDSVKENWTGLSYAIRFTATMN